MIPLNDTIRVFKGEKMDSWGVVTPSTESVDLRCLVSYSTTLEELKTLDGETVVIKATITLKGKSDLSFGDKLVISDTDGVLLKVLQVIPIKDLSGKQLFTKVVV